MVIESPRGMILPRFMVACAGHRVLSDVINMPNMARLEDTKLRGQIGERRHPAGCVRQRAGRSLGRRSIRA